jgi:fructose-bisphosphate aldolase class I
VINAVFASIDKLNKEVETGAAAEKEKGGGGVENETAAAVSLSGLLLKLMPCVPGGDSESSCSPSDSELAGLTLDVLRECVPAEVPGIVLLSGGLSERRATEVLQAINSEKLRRNQTASTTPSSAYPWAISFSFGRALQASAMRLWSQGKLKSKRNGEEREGDEEERASVSEARAAVEASSRANREASRGLYSGPHPTAENGDAADLREGFRGFRDDAVAREAAEAAAVATVVV